MYTSMLGCGEYGYPALDVTGWVPGLPPRNQTIYHPCSAAPLGPEVANATEVCGANNFGLMSTTNNRACFPSWETYLARAHNESWPIWLGSTGATWFSPFYYIFFILVAGIVMLSLFIGAVTLGMQEAMDEYTAARRKAQHEKLMSAARQAKSAILDPDATTNRVMRMWMGEDVGFDEDVDDDDEAEPTFAEAPIRYTLMTMLVWPAARLVELPLFNNFITCAASCCAHRAAARPPKPAGRARTRARARAAIAAARAARRR